MYYLYKIKSVYTKHYYIGVACNFKNRFRDHHYIITRLISYLKDKRRHGIRNINIQYSAVHLFIAKQAVKRPSVDVKATYAVSVIGESDSKMGIAIMESDILYAARNDKFILNIQRTSSGYHKETSVWSRQVTELLIARKIALKAQWEKENSEMYKNVI